MRNKLAFLLACLLIGSPAQAAITVVTSTSVGSASPATTTTTAGINSTGGSLAVLCASSSADTIPAGDVSDSLGHTWTARTEYNSGADAGKIRLFYTILTNTGAGHTFSVAHGDWTGIAVVILAGTHLSSPYNVENGYTGGAASLTIQPGTVTPSEDNEVAVACLGWLTARTIVIDSAFNIQTQKAYATGGAADPGIGLATKIQTTAGAENPTWTLSTFYYQNATIATFKIVGAVTSRSVIFGGGIF